MTTIILSNYSKYVREITIDLQILRDNGIRVANGLEYGIEHLVKGSAVEAFVEDKEGNSLSEIKLWFDEKTERVISSQLDVSNYYNDADEAKYNSLYEARNGILEYYNDTKGMVVSAVEKMRKRIAEEEQKVFQFEKDRRRCFDLCCNLLTELWELEKSGILQYDNQATCSSLVPAETDASLWSIMLEDGHSLSVLSSKEKPCRVMWAYDRQVIAEVTVMTQDGVTLNEKNAINGFMNIAFDFMNDFIRRNNIQ